MVSGWDICTDAHLTFVFAKLIADLDARCAQRVRRLFVFFVPVLEHGQYIVLKGKNKVVVF
jgi:hypothetical protein